MKFVKSFAITKLKPFDRNPRKHDEDIDQLIKSIEHFGWTNPILVQSGTNRIIAGHGRLEAAKRAKLRTVPAIVLEMSNKDARAYTIADNRIAELSEWDQQALRSLIGELHLEKYDTSLLGFSDDELNKIMTPAPSGMERTDLDDTPELPANAITKPGQLWELGDHRLLCGDSTDAKQVARAIGKPRADVVFTDPPYGVAYTGKTKKKMTIRNDDLGDEGTRELIARATRCWPLKPGGSWYVCSPTGDKETAFRLALAESGLPIRQCLVWVKNHFVMGRHDYQNRHESILYGWANGDTHYFLEDRTQDTVLDEQRDVKNLKRKELVELVKEYRRRENTTVWREDRPAASLLHPTTKPIALIQKALRNSSKPGEVVWDGFGGSGSTLIAAESIGRKAVLMELDPRYCDVIVERWKTTTGGHAKLLTK